MSTEPPSDGVNADCIQERQLTLEEFQDHSDGRRQCEAIAEYTGEQCRHKALAGVRYCADHLNLVDAEEVTL